MFTALAFDEIDETDRPFDGAGRLLAMVSDIVRVDAGSTCRIVGFYRHETTDTLVGRPVTMLSSCAADDAALSLVAVSEPGMGLRRPWEIHWEAGAEAGEDWSRSNPVRQARIRSGGRAMNDIDDPDVFARFPVTLSRHERLRFHEWRCRTHLLIEEAVRRGEA